MRFPARSLAVLAVLAIFCTCAAVGLGDPGASGACPAVAPTHEPRSTIAGAARQLVPGRPISALLCRYNGLAEPGVAAAAFTLVGEAHISGSAARELARQFNALAALPSGPVACPADTGTSALVDFRYASGAVDPVDVALDGCASSSNGRRTRAGFPSAVITLTHRR